jgi:glycosyltransferase involved in cell wall biosynthesis
MQDNSHLKISIITVCYNSASTLEKTIKSVLLQKYPHIEYIIIDGSSTDNTSKVLNSYKNKIDVILSEADKGIYHAMNKGIVRANGDIIGFLNADDIFADENVISLIANTFIDKKVDSVYGDLTYFKDTPKNIKRYWRASPFKSGLFSKGWNPPHPTFYVKRSIYQQYGGFDLNMPIANDIELMMRFLEKYRISSYYISKVLVNMRLGGLSNQNWQTIIKQNRAIIKASKALGLPVSVAPFCVGKIIDRLQQRLVAP